MRQAGKVVIARLAGHAPESAVVGPAGHGRDAGRVQGDDAAHQHMALSGKLWVGLDVRVVAAGAGLLEFIRIDSGALEEGIGNQAAGGVSADDGLEPGNLDHFVDGGRGVEGGPGIQRDLVALEAIALENPAADAAVIGEPGIIALIPEELGEAEIEHGIGGDERVVLGPAGQGSSELHALVTLGALRGGVAAGQELIDVFQNAGKEQHRLAAIPERGLGCGPVASHPDHHAIGAGGLIQTVAIDLAPLVVRIGRQGRRLGLFGVLRTESRQRQERQNNR
ncbi:MAG: hypothetical protein BWY77_01908 [bacterium ADurb.Bin431]|nr:MAG: hypothetical protein BWY77_01908 [bacterium ADurb.Bin431]